MKIKLLIVAIVSLFGIARGNLTLNNLPYIDCITQCSGVAVSNPDQLGNCVAGCITFYNPGLKTTIGERELVEKEDKSDLDYEQRVLEEWLSDD